MVATGLSCDIKADTAHMATLKNDTARIVNDLGKLRAQLLRGGDTGRHTRRLCRTVDDLSSYAGSVCDAATDMDSDDEAAWTTDSSEDSSGDDEEDWYYGHGEDLEDRFTSMPGLNPMMFLGPIMFPHLHPMMFPHLTAFAHPMMFPDPEMFRVPRRSDIPNAMFYYAETTWDSEGGDECEFEDDSDEGNDYDDNDDDDGGFDDLSTSKRKQAHENSTKRSGTPWYNPRGAVRRPPRVGPRHSSMQISGSHTSSTSYSGDESNYGMGIGICRDIPSRISVGTSFDASGKSGKDVAEWLAAQ